MRVHSIVVSGYQLAVITRKQPDDDNSVPGITHYEVKPVQKSGSHFWAMITQIETPSKLEKLIYG